MRNSLIILAFSLAALTLPDMTPAAVSAPGVMRYQAVLRDNLGNPLTGSYNMVFHFYDAETAGSEILVDRHEAVGPPAGVAVQDGVFSVLLGSGEVLDGADPLPGEPYLDLASMFRDFPNVWMLMEVDGELMNARIRLAATAYAFNADSIDGKDGDELLDTRSGLQFKSGSLDLGGSLEASELFIDYTIQLNADGGDAEVPQIHFVGPEGTDRGILGWFGGLQLGQFVFTRPVEFSQTISVGTFGTFLPPYNRVGGAVSDHAGLNDASDMFFSGDVEVNGVTYLDGNLELTGTLNSDLVLEGDLFLAGSSGTDRDHIFFDSGTSESLLWEDTQTRFEMSDSLALDGPLFVGPLGDAPHTYNRFGGSGSPAPRSGAMSTRADVYAAGQFEVGGTTWTNDIRSITTVSNMSGEDVRFNSGSQLRFLFDSDNSTTGNFVGWYHDSITTTNQVAKLTEAGNLLISGTLSGGQAFDLAETFQAAELLEPGDVVVIAPGKGDQVRLASAGEDPAVIGVVSRRPGVLLGGAPFNAQALGEAWGPEVLAKFRTRQPALRRQAVTRDPDVAAAMAAAMASPQKDEKTLLQLEDLLESQAIEMFFQEQFVPVALAGRVPVKVDAGYGAIRPGDLLVSSPTPGHAMRAVDPRAGTVIGKALQSLESGTGSILMLVLLR